MSDIAQLITAMAALVTSLGGALAAVIIATRSGNRQAEIASRKTIELNEDPADEEPGSLQAEELQEIINLLSARNSHTKSTTRPSQRREGGRR